MHQHPIHDPHNYGHHPYFHRPMDSHYHKDNECIEPKPPYINKFQQTSVKETNKIAEIRDCYNQLRYKVYLVGYKALTVQGYVTAYRIYVENCFYADGPLTIVSVPESEDDLLTVLEEATRLYEMYKTNYVNLVRAETRDLQKIDVFKSKIGYKQQTFKCCATCKWCERHNAGSENDKMLVLGDLRQLKCRNPEIFGFDNHSVEERRNHRQPFHCNQSHGSSTHHHYNHFYHKPEFHTLPVNPTVNMFGICDYYSDGEHPEILDPTTPLSQIIRDNIYIQTQHVTQTNLKIIDEKIDQKIAETESKLTEKVNSAIDGIGEQFNDRIEPIVEEKVEEMFQNVDIDGNENKEPWDINGNNRVDTNEILLFNQMTNGKYDINGDGQLDQNEVDLANKDLANSKNNKEQTQQRIVEVTIEG